MFDYIVIGKGLIGTAAGRYLSQVSQSVAIIGPDEPRDWRTHQGVFASHYDQGRITRILDADLIWAVLAKRSIEQYRSLEQAGGIRFYYPVGGLQVGPISGKPEDYLAQTEAVGHELGVDFNSYTGSELDRAFPFFHFPAGAAALFEPAPAGYINPRSLIAAQLKLAGQQGATIIREQVISIETRKGIVHLETAEGGRYQSRKVLIAAGAYTNKLLERKLKLELRARTILLAELPEAEVNRLKQMPTLIYKEIVSNPSLESIYLLPPIQYSDGKYYLKIGGGNLPTMIAHSYDELQQWFQSGGSQAEAEALKESLLSLIPGLQATSFHYKPCVTTYTPHNHPYIDVIEEQHIFVATGGCGSAAKSSNEIGRAAALLAQHGDWRYDLAEKTFELLYL
jgi:sarcosine oxidase